MDKIVNTCAKCVMDDLHDVNLHFDDNGICNICNAYEKDILPTWNYGKGHEAELNQLISLIKKSGRKKQYDCILGLSGGLDSSYMLHLAVKEWGLRPYVLHIDCGWDLPVSIKNLSSLTEKLGVELHVLKMDPVEMREMQLAWFKTGLASLDAPQDHAFIALVDKYAKKIGVKYILNGYNIATEVVADPKGWDEGSGHTGDKTFMKDVIKKFCSIPIKKYVFTSGFKHKFVYPYIFGIKTLKPLNLVPITKQLMIDTLANEYGFIYYGQKHFEDSLTKFLEGWWLPTKFGYDIRKSQLSSLIITGQLTKEEAIKILKNPPLTEKESGELFKLVADKLEITEDQLWDLYKKPKCNVKFKTNSGLYNFGIKLYEKLGLEKRIRQ